MIASRDRRTGDLFDRWSEMGEEAAPAAGSFLGGGISGSPPWWSTDPRVVA